MGKRLKDYDVWYLPCQKCGTDTGKSKKPKGNNKTCWKCGSFIYRDFSDRALKKPEKHTLKFEVKQVNK